MESDDFVAKNVLARSERLRDGDSPLAVGGDELVGSPLARGRAAIDQTGLVDLEELQSLLVDTGAVVAGALGEVVDDGTVVRLGPGVGAPLELNLATGGDRGGDLAGSTIVVADDIAGGVGGGVHETVVAVLRAPGDDVRGAVGVEVVVDETGVLFAANYGNAGDTAMGVGRSGKRAQKGSGLEEGHCIGLVAGTEIERGVRRGFEKCWMCLRKGKAVSPGYCERVTMVLDRE